jgi:Asp-tRNA(Asn)/Glu-tRNA(Gln) amidotransferase A subunit family amidase
MDDRAFASATELSEEIRDRRIGCAELLDFYLARTERHNPALESVTAVYFSSDVTISISRKRCNDPFLR